jgi:4-carboxymuconolactone decarboxylase
MTDRQQDYIDKMATERGYVLPYHRVMAGEDWDVLVAANTLVHEAYLRPRLLDRKTKELLFILSLVVMRASPEHIQSHIRVAVEHGASRQEILEAIEISLPEAGVVVFQYGLEIWADYFGVAGLAPSGADAIIAPGEAAPDRAPSSEASARS